MKSSMIRAVKRMVSIFGRDTRVDDLEFAQVEEITEETETVYVNLRLQNCRLFLICLQ